MEAEVTGGRYTLLAILSERRGRGREVALRCGVSPSRVSEWASGKARPSKRARKALEEAFGIAASSWDRQVSMADRERIRLLSTTER